MDKLYFWVGYLVVNFFIGAITIIILFFIGVRFTTIREKLNKKLWFKYYIVNKTINTETLRHLFKLSFTVRNHSYRHYILKFRLRNIKINHKPLKPYQL